MTQYEAITPDILDELKAISGHRCLLYTSDAADE